MEHINKVSVVVCDQTFPEEEYRWYLTSSKEVGSMPGSGGETPKILTFDNSFNIDRVLVRTFNLFLLF